MVPKFSTVRFFCHFWPIFGHFWTFFGCLRWAILSQICPWDWLTFNMYIKNEHVHVPFVNLIFGNFAWNNDVKSFFRILTPVVFEIWIFRPVPIQPLILNRVETEAGWYLIWIYTKLSNCEQIKEKLSLVQFEQLIVKVRKVYKKHEKWPKMGSRNTKKFFLPELNSPNFQESLVLSKN